MKRKVFRDWLWPLLMGCEIICTLCAWIPLIYFFVVFKTDGAFDSPQFAFSFFAPGTLIIAMWFFLFNLPIILDRAFGRLLVYEDKVVLKCLFRTTKKLTLEECKYVGVENYNDLKRALPVVRGDEASFIYLSTKPFPEKYRGKISTLKSHKGFIKFSYSDKLALALIDILPEDKSARLKGFYKQMQISDLVIKQKKNKKNKKNKKK